MKAIVQDTYSSADVLELTESTHRWSATTTCSYARTFPLSEAPEAIRYLEQGHTAGKVVISM